MRTKLVKRFYCDHCSKGSLSRVSMERHEAICFRNKHRSCYLCESISTEMPGLVSVLRLRGLQALRDVTSGCPACIMAAIIQDWIGGRKEAGEDESIPFDYKAELAEWRKKETSSEWAGYPDFSCFAEALTPTPAASEG